MNDKEKEILTQMIDEKIANYQSVKERTRKSEHWDEKIAELEAIKVKVNGN